jgi:WD40 repeat protein
MDMREEETEQKDPPPRSPREVFAHHLRLLFVDAGEPKLEAVAAEAARLGAVGVTVKRLSAWRQGHNLPRWEQQLHPLLVVLIKWARKTTPHPGVPERYDYRWWQERWKDARRRTPQGKAKGTQAIPAAETPIVEIPCPYRGLEVFRVEDEPYFHGRADSTAALLSLLSETAATGGICMLVATSGAGKSSLIQAGVIPKLKHNALCGSATWPVVVMSPGEDPVANLTREVPDLADALRTADADHNADQLAERVRTVIRAYAERKAGHDARLVLIVDQAEELFTLCEAADSRERFVAVLDAASTATPFGTDSAPAVVLVSVRADFTAPCLADPALGPLAEAYIHRQLVLQAMKPAELQEAITVPAKRAGLKVQRELVEHVLREVGARRPGRARGRRADPGLLPLLSHALLETWRRHEGGQLTLDAYIGAGGIEQAVARTADRTWTQLGPGEQTAAMSLLLRMTRIGHDTQDTRRRCDKPQLIEQAPNPAAAEKALAILSAARLITVDAEAAQITHEALLNAWPLLREAIDADRAGHLLRQDLEEQARKWKADDRSNDHLWRGTRLAAARSWEHSNKCELSPAASDFLTASIYQDRRARNVRRAAVGVLATTVVIALAATVFAFAQSAAARRERDTVIFNQVIAQADRLRDTNASLAAQLYLTAYRMRATPDLYTNLITTENIPLSTPLTGHHGIVRAAFSPDGKTLVSVGTDDVMRLWDMTDPAHPALRGQPVALHASAERGVAYSPDGKTLAIACGDGTVRLWNLADPSRPAPLGEPLPGGSRIVYGVAFSPDGKTLVSVADDNVMRLWNMTDPSRPAPLGAPLPGGSEGNGSAAFSPDGKTLAAASSDGTLRLWDVTDPSRPAPLGAPLAGGSRIVYGVTFSPNGKTLVSVGGDNVMRLWDVTDPAHPTLLIEPLTKRTTSILAAAFSADGRTLATGSADTTVTLWNVTDPTNAIPLGRPLTGHTRGVGGLVFSPDGQTLATASADSTVRIWHLPATRLSGFPHGVTAVTFSPNRRLLAAVSMDHTVRLWDVTRYDHPEQVSPPLTGSRGYVMSVAFSPDGKTLASGGRDGTGGTVRLSDVSDPRHARPLGQAVNPNTTLGAVAFSPDGKTLAIGGDDRTVRLVDISTPTHPVLLDPPLIGHDNQVEAVEFSPDGKTLASASADHTLRLWNVANVRHPASLGPPLLGHTDAVFSLAYSPDGKTLASASADHTLRLWNVADPAHAGPLGQPLALHSDAVGGVAYSPDGKILASASDDETVQLWNVTGPAHATPRGRPLTGHTDFVYTVAFSPNGQVVASGGRDRTVLLWQLNVDQAISRICATTANELTPTQWARYVSPDLPYHPPCS